MGNRLKQLRRQRGLSQAKLAAAAGIPVGTLRGWEYGRRTPLLDAATRVALALGVSLDKLAGIAEGDVPPAPAAKKTRKKK
jgi:transcriptional regulator with XRE-family HTH domain